MRATVAAALRGGRPAHRRRRGARVRGPPHHRRLHRHTGGIADELAARTTASAWCTTTQRKLGGALKTGFAGAPGDLVLYTDADMPFDLTAAQGAAPSRLRRRHRRAPTGSTAPARAPRGVVYSYVYNHMVQAAAVARPRRQLRVQAVRRRVLDHLELRSEGSFIDVELLAKGQRMGFHIIQFGVDYFPRARGISTLSSPAVIVGILREFASLYRDRRGATRPVADRPPRRG